MAVPISSPPLVMKFVLINFRLPLSKLIVGSPSYHTSITILNFKNRQTTSRVTTCHIASFIATCYKHISVFTLHSFLLFIWAIRFHYWIISVYDIYSKTYHTCTIYILYIFYNERCRLLTTTIWEISFLPCWGALAQMFPSSRSKYIIHNWEK